MEANLFDSSELSLELNESIQNTTGHIISIESGADAYFQAPLHKEGDPKKPMLLILHGGPFGSSQYHRFIELHHFFLA